MGIEYISCLPSPAIEALPALIRQLIQTASLVEAQVVSGSGVGLRWAGQPVRSDWPEDVTISWDSQEVLLCFHAATRTQRDKLIEYLCSSLSKVAQEKIKFEEI